MCEKKQEVSGTITCENVILPQSLSGSVLEKPGYLQMTNYPTGNSKTTITVVDSPMTKEDNALVKQLKDAIDDEETETNGKSLGVLDILTQKIMSRKLLVFVISTVLLFMNRIDAQNWVLISSIYISSQAIIEVVAGLKKKSDTNEEEGSV